MTPVLHLDTATTWRGGQQQVYLLHRELLRRRVDSRLLAAPGGALLARCRAEGLAATPLPGRRWWDPRVLLAVLRGTRGGLLVHSHDAHAATPAWLARRWGRAGAWVCHRRVSYPLRRGGFGARRYAAVDRWIAVSAEVARSLEAAGVAPGRIRVQHSALDLDGFRGDAAAADAEALRAELDLGPGVQVVGCAAAFSPQKGHKVLLQAAARVLAQVPGEVVFLLPGAGPELTAMRAEAQRLGIVGACRFPGFRGDVAALTGLFTVAVVPSVDGEGSSAAIKEPMALGRPTVVSDLPGNLEVLGDAGLSFANRDPAALATCLLRLLREPELRDALGERGRDRVERFTPGAMADGVLAAYREVLGCGSC